MTTALNLIEKIEQAVIEAEARRQLRQMAWPK
jgi:hypothetical protein